MGWIWNRKGRNQEDGDTRGVDMRIRTGPRGGRRMSEVLHDVAEPLLDGLRLPEHKDAFGACLKLAAAVWNASLLESRRERQRALTEVKRSIRAPGSREQLEMMIERTYHRAMKLYPEEKRPIAGVELAPGSDGRYHINVASMYVE